MIELRRVSVRLGGTEVLHGVSFTVPAGQTIAMRSPPTEVMCG